MHRALTALLVSLLAIVVALPSAGAGGTAEIVSGTDARGDAVAGRGDVRQWELAYLPSTSQYRARISLHRGDTPTSAHWFGGDTELRIYWDTDFVDPGAEYITRLETGLDASESNLTLVASTYAADTQVADPVCQSYSPGTNTTTAYVAPNLYRVKFAESCLGSPQQVRARIEMRYDAPPGGGNIGIDKAPNSGWSPRF